MEDGKEENDVRFGDDKESVHGELIYKWYILESIIFLS